jgi:hypothetical protein
MSTLLYKIISQTHKAQPLFHSVKDHFSFHLQQIMIENFDPENISTVDPQILHKAISRVLRDRVVVRMAETNKAYRDNDVRRINYFS